MKAGSGKTERIWCVPSVGACTPVMSGTRAVEQTGAFA